MPAVLIDLVQAEDQDTCLAVMTGPHHSIDRAAVLATQSTLATLCLVMIAIVKGVAILL